MIGKKLRVRSQAADLGYISPWKLQQETSRNNDLELFLSKNRQQEEVVSPKFRWAKTEALTGKPPRPEVTSSKKTARTEMQAHTMTDFRQSLLRTYNRKFYSRSASLHTSQHFRTEPRPTEEQVIFAKRCRQSQKPKLVTLGNHPGQETQDAHASFKSSVSRAARRKKEFMLKKQSLTQGMLKGEIVNHKGFITSLEGCLAEMEKGSVQGEVSSVLKSTMKNFLTHYKKL